MSIFDDDNPKPVRVHEIGQDLSLLSVAELQERIVQLRAEIERIEADLADKDRTKNAAEALFRKG